MLKLITSTCDTSGCTNSRRKVLVVEYYHNGTPVLTHCRDCAPDNWRLAAEKQKEDWLRGE
jgi:hypothetical protein